MCAAAQGSLRDAEFAKAVCNRLRFYSSSMGGKRENLFSLSDNLLSSSAVKKLLLFLFELSLSLSIFLRSRFVFPSLSCPSGGNFLLSTRNSTQRRRCRIPVSRRLETTGQKHDKQKKNKIYIFYKGRRNSNSGTVKKKKSDAEEVRDNSREKPLKKQLHLLPISKNNVRLFLFDGPKRPTGSM